MSLRLKLIAVVVGLCAVASTSVGLATYRSTSTELNSQVDRSLRMAVEQLVRSPLIERSRNGPVRARRTLRDFRATGDMAIQVLGPRGIEAAWTNVELPVSAEAVDVAGAVQRLELWENVVVGGRGGTTGS